ncbi:MAG: hypothetical protein ABF723_05255 [Lentilactobacillus hilgardii]|uniref:hypothetical protein n=1 Tax=Lentilactobacillus hilgardii TaxID=1588 RepID=UPI0039EA4EF0
MDTEELRDYLAENSSVEDLFTSRCLQYLEEKNQNRPAAKRWPQEKIDRVSAKMYYSFLQNIHDKISNRKGLAKHDPSKWENFIKVHNIVDELEESVVDIEFE